MRRVAQIVIRLSLTDIRNVKYCDKHSSLTCPAYRSWIFNLVLICTWSDNRTALIWMNLSASSKTKKEEPDFPLLKCIFLVKKWKQNKWEGLHCLAVLFLMKGCETAHIYRRCLLQMENFIYPQGDIELQQGHIKQRTHRQFIDFSPRVFTTYKNWAWQKRNERWHHPKTTNRHDGHDEDIYFKINKWDNDNKLEKYPRHILSVRKPLWLGYTILSFRTLYLGYPSL